MHGSSVRALGVGVVLLVAGAAFGCTGSPIGDPCTPESIPPGGYDDREIYIETSSVQCRTRVCMVYQLEGQPETNCRGLPEDPPECTQVFCSCRCSTSGGGQANTPLCACGDGFTCVDDVVTTGGEGVRGGYCVPCKRRNGETRTNLPTDVFDDCPEPS